MSDLNRRLGKLEVIWKRPTLVSPDRGEWSSAQRDRLSVSEMERLTAIQRAIEAAPRKVRANGSIDLYAVGDDDLDFLADIAERLAGT